MKNSKLIEIFKNGNIVIPIYLIKNYKNLNLDMEEFVFLMYLYNLGNNFLFDPSKFSKDLGIDIKSVMNYISVLSEKRLIRVEVLKNDKDIMEEVVILDDFYNKLTHLTIEEISNTEEDHSNIFEIIEKEFGRTLSPMEMEIIKAWLKDNISEELIKEALKEASFNGVSNLRYIDKILYEWGKRKITTVEDVEKLRKARNKKEDKEEKDPIIDTEIFDCGWLDEEE